MEDQPGLARLILLYTHAAVDDAGHGGGEGGTGVAKRDAGTSHARLKSIAIHAGKDTHMSLDDRFDAAKDDVKGKAKESWGKATDDESTEAEGKLDQVKGDLKEGMADVKDKLGDAKDKLTGNDN